MFKQLYLISSLRAYNKSVHLNQSGEEAQNYVINDNIGVWQACADPGFFFRGGPRPTARKQSGQGFVFFSQLILQFTEGAQ